MTSYKLFLISTFTGLSVDFHVFFPEVQHYIAGVGIAVSLVFLIAAVYQSKQGL